MRHVFALAVVLAGCHRQPPPDTSPDYGALLADAHARVARDDTDGAERIAQQVARSDAPAADRFDALMLCAHIDYLRGHWRAAATNYTMAELIAPDARRRALALLGRADAKAKLPAESRREIEADLTRAVELDPTAKAEADRIRYWLSH